MGGNTAAKPEDTEGLLPSSSSSSSSSVGSGGSIRRSIDSSNKLGDLINHLTDGKHKRKTLSIAACVAVVFLILLFAGDGKAKDLEKGGGAELADVERKGSVAVVDVSGSDTPDATPDAVVEGEDSNENDNDGPSFSSQSATGKQKELIEKWGEWRFWDKESASRPKDDYCSKYPSRDIPSDQFPPKAWQTDPVYVKNFIKESLELVDRAMEGIYTEYGYGKPLSPDKMEKREKMFHLFMGNITTNNNRNNILKEAIEGAGWTTERSYEGLKRRLLHSIITNDSFTMVLGGHSAAAGHGNHFKQSYMMVLYRFMKPIFERLGVDFVSRNIAQGGLGTLQHSLGSSSIYGDEVDFIIWDSGMTEGGKPEQDLFGRQAILGGKRVPVIFGQDFDVLRNLHENADVDVLSWGTRGKATAGIIEVTNETQAETIAWAARHIRCTRERGDLCNDHDYKWRAVCWIDRPDVTPLRAQRQYPTSQVGWHPGFRTHQLQARILSFILLTALKDAFNMWSEVTNGGAHPLPDEYWHVTEYYDNIRQKVKELDPEIGDCYKKEGLPSRVCSIGLRGYTEFTPRANPEKTGILSILKPAPDGYIPPIPKDKKLFYEGEDVYNPSLDPPEDEFDVYAILGNRRRRALASSDRDEIEEPGGNVPTFSHWSPIQGKPPRIGRGLRPVITPGRGWERYRSKDGYCDGTYNGICNREPNSDCLLSGHMDARGGLLGNEYSGWLVMTLKDLKEGLLIIKMESNHFDRENKITVGWKTVNNEARRLGEVLPSNYTSDMHSVFGGLSESGNGAMDVAGRRFLGQPPPPELPETFFFDFAIDGVITSWNKTEWLDHKQQVQRVVELWTLLDDPDFSKKGPKDVELGIRMRGCGRVCTLLLTHVYYA